MTNYCYLFCLLLLMIDPIVQQQIGTTTVGAMNQNIYQFLSQLPAASKYYQYIDTISKQTQDYSIVKALSADPSVQQSQNGYTVFVPINDALTNVPRDALTLRNDLYNFVVKDRLTLDRLRTLSGSNLSLTFGNMPRLFVRVAKNFYKRPLNPQLQQGQSYPNQQYNQQQQQQQQQQQYYPTTQYPNQQQQQQQYPNQQYPQQPQQQYPQQQYPQQQYPQQQYPNQQYPNQQNYPSNITTNMYNYFNSIYQASTVKYDGPPISLEFPQDELFIINDAILLEKYELTNGIVYLMNGYPRYYDTSLWDLVGGGTINGLAQNLNFWVTQAKAATRVGNDNLYNAMRTYGSNTYFLPADIAFQKFTDRDKLNNFTFLYDILFKSHRISNQILFDYYLDSPDSVFYTDTLLPVNTVHRRVAGQATDDIEISIGHVKGKIIPELRNIFCVSGVIHIIDSVLGIPTRSAYQQLMQMTELSVFRQLVDSSSKYRTMLDQLPSTIIYPTQPPIQRNNALLPPRHKRQNFFFNDTTTSSSTASTTQQQAFGIDNVPNYQQNNPYQFPQQNQNQYASDIKYMTILAPSDASLVNIQDMLKQNQSALEDFLSRHIIIDNDYNRVFYTDHDQSVFQSGSSYATLNPSVRVVAQVTQSPNEVMNRVTLTVQGQPNIMARITSGNERVANGVIHTLNKPLMQYVSPDLMTMLDRYSSVTTTQSSQAFNQFYDMLKSTGIYNDLKQVNRPFTLFIPTNNALNQYPNLINDANLRKLMVLSHVEHDLSLNKDNSTSDLVVNDEPVHLNTHKNTKMHIERDYDGDTYFVLNDGTRAKVMQELNGDNGNAYIIDNVLHAKKLNTNDAKSNTLLLTGHRSSNNLGSSLLSHSSSFDLFSNSNRLVINYYHTYLIVVLVAVLNN